MSIDYSKSNYVRVGNYSNVLYEYDKRYEEDYAGFIPHLHEKISPMVHKLSLAHPDWTFVMSGGRIDRINKRWANVHNTRVVCEDEAIGVFKLDTWKNGTPIEVDCPAISASRARRGGAWTTKPDKAYKLVEQNFRPMETGVKLRKSTEKLKSVVSSNYWGANRKFGDIMERLRHPLAAYTLANMEDVKNSPFFPAASVAELEAMPERFAAYKDANYLEQSLKNNNGTIVVVMKDKYYVSRDGFATHEIKASHELSDDLAGKIGVLKALDVDDQMVETIGIRVEKNTYFIL